MVTCNICKSRNVRVANGNFASVKPEGQPAEIHKYDKKLFHCWDCEINWESSPEADKDYSDYLWLRGRTQLRVRDMSQNKDFGPIPHIDIHEVFRKNELAKKIVSSYQQLLDISPSEWYEVNRDAL